jgi:hypothetical protein
MSAQPTSSGNGRWGKLALVNAAVAAWLIYDITTASEAPRQAVAMLEYFLLACALIALAGSLIKLTAAK